MKRRGRYGQIELAERKSNKSRGRSTRRSTTRRRVNKYNQNAKRIKIKVFCRRRHGKPKFVLQNKRMRWKKRIYSEVDGELENMQEREEEEVAEKREVYNQRRRTLLRLEREGRTEHHVRMKRKKNCSMMDAQEDGIS